MRDNLLAGFLVLALCALLLLGSVVMLCGALWRPSGRVK